MEGIFIEKQRKNEFQYWEGSEWQIWIDQSWSNKDIQSLSGLAPSDGEQT